LTFRYKADGYVCSTSVQSFLSTALEKTATEAVLVPGILTSQSTCAIRIVYYH